jgi:hypothetical protein
MMSDPNPHTHPITDAMIRDPLASRDAVREARCRSMSERLELALSWNMMASELRAGLAEVKGRAQRR